MLGFPPRGYTLAASLLGTGLAGLYAPLECGSVEFYAHTIATVRLRNTIDDSRVLWVPANQGGEQRYTARLPVPAGHYPSAVGAGVFRDGRFASSGLFKAGRLALAGGTVSLRNSD